MSIVMNSDFAAEMALRRAHVAVARTALLIERAELSIELVECVDAESILVETLQRVGLVDY